MSADASLIQARFAGTVGGFRLEVDFSFRAAGVTAGEAAIPPSGFPAQRQSALTCKRACWTRRTGPFRARGAAARPPANPGVAVAAATAAVTVVRLTASARRPDSPA